MMREEGTCLPAKEVEAEKVFLAHKRGDAWLYIKGCVVVEFGERARYRRSVIVMAICEYYGWR